MKGHKPKVSNSVQVSQSLMTQDDDRGNILSLSLMRLDIETAVPPS